MLNLYEARVLSRQTQHVLAKKTGISQTRICLIETGFANPKEADKEKFLYGLIEKYFPTMVPGEHYRPITEKELKRTSVYAISIEKWSGKRNWEEKAEQGDEWPPLGEEWFA